MNSKPIQQIRSKLLATFLAFVLISLACGKGPAARTIIVVSEQGFQIMGETPIRKAPGLFYLFRVDQKPDHLSSKILGFTGGKAGEVYGIDEKGSLKKIGMFDVRRSDEQLAKDYGVKTQ